ncbi:hypothetical protein D3C87_2182970 [compost metagenome]
MTLTPTEISNIAGVAAKALRDTSSYAAQIAAIENAIRQALAQQFEKLVTIVPASNALVHGGLLNLHK